MFLIPFGSDSLYLEIASDLTGRELSPGDRTLIPDASHKLQVALPVLRVEFPNLISLLEVLSHSGGHLCWLRQRTQMRVSTGQVSMWEGAWGVSALSGNTDLPQLPCAANHLEALWSSVKTFWHEYSRSPDSHLDLLLIG